ncbi:hypothetical protein TNCV_1347281 [Trichonephila clavipes]|nr:hypothetical protein TNCV_1347281 [Trichonephila clavipes]
MGRYGYHFRTPLVRISGTINSQLYIYGVGASCPSSHSGLATAIFNRIMRDHTWRIVQTFFVNHQIEISSLAGSLSGPFTDRKHVVLGWSTIDQITPQLPH